jgi:hypothetical protein
VTEDEAVLRTFLDAMTPTRRRGLGRRTLELIDASIEILEEIQPATVRAVCYQLFTRKLIPSMAKTETNRVGRMLTRAREDGRIDWDWIVTETHELEKASTWAQPDEFVATVRLAYRKDHWALQPNVVEVWSEKGTVRGLLGPVLDEYGVGFRVMHGFAPATIVHQVAEAYGDGPRPFIPLYVGDWDPSGMYMSVVDLPGRLECYGGETIEVKRIALAQEDTLGDLPSFPAAEKQKDPRYAWFVQHYGHRCWELDAMNPNDLRARVESIILGYIDHAVWERSRLAEEAECASLATVLDRWGGNGAGAD